MKKLTELNTRVVDTSRLEVDMIVKNYKEMCKLLGEEELSPNGKKTQIANWERFFKFIRQGQKFGIVEIYENPLPPKIDGKRTSLSSSNGEYIIMKLLEEECIKQEQPYLYIPRSHLYQRLYLTNKDYAEFNKNRDSFMMKLKLASINATEKQIDKVFDICDSKFYSVLNTILNSMEKSKLIGVDSVYLLNKGDGNGYVEAGYSYKINKETGELLEETDDNECINLAKEEALDNFVERGLIDEPDYVLVIRKHLLAPFYKMINAILFREYNWVGCFRAFKIKPILGDKWDTELTYFTENLDTYKQNLQNNTRTKITEKCNKEIFDSKERKIIDLFISYLLQYDEMSKQELQEQYAMIMNGEYTMDNTTDPNNTWDTPIPENDSTPTKKQKEEKSMSKTSKPILTTTHEPTYTQPDYSDIPDDWEQIYESLERKDRECEAAMRKLEEQEQSKHKPVNTEMFTAMFGTQGDAHTQENTQGNVQAVDISNLLDFSEEKCESESTDSAYASVQFGASAYRGDEYSWNDVDVVDRPDRKVSEFEEWEIKGMARSI